MLRIPPPSWPMLAGTALAVMFAGFTHPANTVAEETAINVPSIGLSEQFTERSNISWALRGPNWFARFGAPAWAEPPAGHSGVGQAGSGVSGNFDVRWSRKAQRSAASRSSTLTLPQGSMGGLWNQSWSPFVTGYVPAFGPGLTQPPVAPGAMNLPSWIDPATGRIRGLDSHNAAAPERADATPEIDANEPPLLLGGDHIAAGENGPSTAAQPVAGVAAAEQARRRELAERNRTARGYLQKGEAALVNGKPAVARAYYRLALRYASGETMAEVINKLRQVADLEASEAGEPAPGVPQQR